MHDCTRQLLSDLDARHAELLTAVEGVPVELRGRRPEAERWSVAEVLEHLAVIESRIGRMIRKEIEALPVMPSDWSGPRVPVIDMERILDRGQRITGPEIVQPREGLTWDAAWQRLEEARAGTRGVLESADRIDLGSVVRPHPVLGDLDLYQWIAFLGAHEARHALQIREAGEMLVARE
jgi:DinB superfamily